MKILDSICVVLEEENILRKYYYRLTETLFNKSEVFGIEVEREDYTGDTLTKIERETLPIISQDKNSVQALLSKLHKNLVSPIHVIYIIGEDMDNMAYSFN